MLLKKMMIKATSYMEALDRGSTLRINRTSISPGVLWTRMASMWWRTSKRETNRRCSTCSWKRRGRWSRITRWTASILWLRLGIPSHLGLKGSLTRRTSLRFRETSQRRCSFSRWLRSSIQEQVGLVEFKRLQVIEPNRRFCQILRTKPCLRCMLAPWQGMRDHQASTRSRTPRNWPSSRNCCKKLHR